MWIEWKNKKPEPGKHIYVKDYGTDEWDVGFAMGDRENIEVAIANDPTTSRFIFDL